MTMLPSGARNRSHALSSHDRSRATPPETNAIPVRVASVVIRASPAGEMSNRVAGEGKRATTRRVPSQRPQSKGVPRQDGYIAHPVGTVHRFELDGVALRKGNAATVPADSDRPDRSATTNIRRIGLVENLSDWKLDCLLAIGSPCDHGQRLAVGTPIGSDDAVQKFARRPAREGAAR
jgi:hypothetical protein